MLYSLIRLDRVKMHCFESCLLQQELKYYWTDCARSQIWPYQCCVVFFIQINGAILCHDIVGITATDMCVVCNWTFILFPSPHDFLVCNLVYTKVAVLDCWRPRCFDVCFLVSPDEYHSMKVGILSSLCGFNP